MGPASRRSTLPLFLVLWLLSPPCSATAQGPPDPSFGVPPDLQSVIFSKIFRYGKTLPEGDALSLLLVADDEPEDQVADLGAAFSQLGLSVRRVSPAALDEAAQEGMVLYLFPSAATKEVTELAAARGLLSITGFEDLVRRGEASFGLTVENERPKILVNLKRLRSEGHRFSADLLKLAEVIR